jgi:F-type H+-transporting ATPase subunit delta
MMVDEVARRYAEAAYEAAGGLDQAEVLAQELAAVDAALREAPELRAAMVHPLIPADRKVRVLARLLGDHLGPLSQRVLRVLFAHGRWSALGGVVAALQERVDRERKRQRVTVRSVVELTAQQLDQVRQALERRLGQSVVLETQLDPSLMGGLEVRVGEETLDRTVARRLRELRDRLLGARAG